MNDFIFQLWSVSILLPTHQYPPAKVKQLFIIFPINVHPQIIILGWWSLLIFYRNRSTLHAQYLPFSRVRGRVTCESVVSANVSFLRCFVIMREYYHCSREREARSRGSGDAVHERSRQFPHQVAVVLFGILWSVLYTFHIFAYYNSCHITY